MSDKLVTIATYDDNIEAEFAKQKLGDYGIDSVLSGLNTTITYAGASAIIEIELQVMESNAQKALGILNQPEKQADDSREHDIEQEDKEQE